MFSASLSDCEQYQNLLYKINIKTVIKITPSMNLKNGVNLISVLRSVLPRSSPAKLRILFM